jgi:hypothetical protein
MEIMIYNIYMMKNIIINVVDIHGLSNTGAYGEHAWTVFSVVGQKTLPMYRAKARRFHGDVVYTNTTTAGAFRGYGATQGTFALESAINELVAQYKSYKVPVLIYPAEYADEKGIPYEKQYQLWILSVQYGNEYMEFMQKKFRIGYK